MTVERTKQSYHGHDELEQHNSFKQTTAVASRHQCLLRRSLLLLKIEQRGEVGSFRQPLYGH